MRDYEKLTKKKNEETAVLQQKINELQKKNKFSIEKEVKRLGLLLSEADNNLKQKDNTISELEAKIEELMEENYNVKGSSYTQQIDKDNKSLKEKVETLEEEKKELVRKMDKMKESEKKRVNTLESEQEITRKLQKELSSVYKDIMNLSNTITAILKGEEPNVQTLWESSSEKYMEESKFDIGSLKTAVSTIRTKVCDYYAERYSNECSIQ